MTVKLCLVSHDEQLKSIEATLDQVYAALERLRMVCIARCASSCAGHPSNKTLWKPTPFGDLRGSIPASVRIRLPNDRTPGERRRRGFVVQKLPTLVAQKISRDVVDGEQAVG